MEYNRPTKHSLTLRGHRTSVSLEQEFWDGFRNIADAEDMTLNALGAQIDIERGVDCGLASAIRLFVFHWYQDQSN